MRKSNSFYYEHNIVYYLRLHDTCRQNIIMKSIMYNECHFKVCHPLALLKVVIFCCECQFELEPFRKITYLETQFILLPSGIFRHG